jgi:RNA polymerase primary sigma factor
MKEVTEYPRITVQEEMELARKIQEEDCEVSYNRMIEANLKFVVKLAHDFAKANVPIEELICVGNIGLMTAAKKYKPNPLCKFSTYSQWWIKQAIRRHCNDHSEVVRTPVQSQAKINKIKTFIKDYKEEHNDEMPPLKLIAKELEVTEKTIKGYIPLLRKSFIYLDASMTEDDNDHSAYDYYLKDVKKEDEIFFDNLDMTEKMNEIKNVLNNMSEREYIVISMRFGLFEYAGNPHTLEDVSHVVRRTRERVRQIEKSALEKLKKMLVYGDNTDTFKAMLIASNPEKAYKKRKTKSKKHQVLRPEIEYMIKTMRSEAYQKTQEDEKDELDGSQLIFEPEIENMIKSMRSFQR